MPVFLFFTISWCDVEGLMMIVPDNLINGSFIALQRLTSEPLHSWVKYLNLFLFFFQCKVLKRHMNQEPQHTSALIHRGFINSVPQKEDQANLPPTVRPRCSLKVASERPINQCSFNLSNRKKKMKVLPLHRRTQSSEDLFHPLFF